MNLREKFKQLCKEKGMTQKDVADRIGMSDISLNRVFRMGNPNLQTLVKISNALGVEVWELLVDDDRVMRRSQSGFMCPKCGAKLKLVEDTGDE